MSLTEQGQRDRLWKWFPALREILEKCKISIRWHGPSTVYETEFDTIQKAANLYALLESNQEVIRDLANTLRSRSEVLLQNGEQEEAAKTLKHLKTIREELHMLADFQMQISDIFKGKAKHIQQISQEISCPEK